MTRLTRHQKEVLLRLARMSGRARDGWVLGVDSGSPAGLEHLYDKGYVERVTRFGERGGERRHYRPTEEGWKVADKDKAKAVEREMPMGEIDTRLIEARRDDGIVKIFVGPKRAEFRGVPGEVARDEDGVLRMQFGARRIALMSITKVEAG